MFYSAIDAKEARDHYYSLQKQAQVSRFANSYVVIRPSAVAAQVGGVLQAVGTRLANLGASMKNA